MEVIRGWTHRLFVVDDASRIGEARRHCASLAAGLGWSEVDAGRLAIVVTELATNLARHAKGGRLLIAQRDSMHDIELISIDNGPGIPSLAQSMRDGYSTGGTAGTGLGAIGRIADSFDCHSSVPQGTVCVARVQAAGTPPQGRRAFELGAVCLPAPGETACGDAWAAAFDSERIALLVADGLGHGPEAARASGAAVEAFAADPFADLHVALQDVHRALQSSRGAALFCLRAKKDEPKLQYAGAGNVCGRVVSGTYDRSMVTQHGTAGLQMRRVDAAQTDWPAHSLALVHSDGIATRWDVKPWLSALGRDPSLLAALLLRDHSRVRDDATVVAIRMAD
ncbi:MAG: histidine kinase [Variovorax sp.]|nr:MAG: histidine kinase [Variovorax sp.]